MKTYTPEQYLYAVRQLHYWQYGDRADNFSSILYILFQKADADNRSRLALGFPEYHDAWMEWNRTESQDAFFAKYNLPARRLDEPYETHKEDGFLSELGKL